MFTSSNKGRGRLTEGAHTSHDNILDDCENPLAETASERRKPSGSSSSFNAVTEPLSFLQPLPHDMGQICSSGTDEEAVAQGSRSRGENRSTIKQKGLPLEKSTELRKPPTCPWEK
jgi:hypothetical protein